MSAEGLVFVLTCGRSWLNLMLRQKAAFSCLYCLSFFLTSSLDVKGIAQYFDTTLMSVLQGVTCCNYFLARCSDFLEACPHRKVSRKTWTINSELWLESEF